MGHYDSSRPGYCSCGAGPGNIKNGVCNICGPRRGSAAKVPWIKIPLSAEVKEADKFRIVNATSTEVSISIDPNPPAAGESMSLHAYLEAVKSKLMNEWRAKGLAVLRSLPSPGAELADLSDAALELQLLKMNHLTQDAGHNNIDENVVLIVPKEWTVPKEDFKIKLKKLDSDIEKAQAALARLQKAREEASLAATKKADKKPAKPKKPARKSGRHPILGGA